jgi:hypothetical protein
VLALQVHALYGKGQEEEEYIPEEHKQDFEIADKYFHLLQDCSRFDRVTFHPKSQSQNARL